MINIDQFRELIVRSTLNDMYMFSPEAEELIIFTCAVETEGGTYLKQINGNALGIYQMEPLTHTDIWQNYIKDKPQLLFKLLSIFNISQIPGEERMIYDLRYATAMVRLFYKRFSKKLPNPNDVDALWDYYKTYYNTDNGKAERTTSIAKYLSFINN